MIVVMKNESSNEDVDNVVDRLQEKGVSINKIVGVDCTVIGVVGDTSKIDREQLALLPGVDKVIKVQEPFKKANRAFKKTDSIVEIGNIRFGGSEPVVIAGPCSVESEEQIVTIAKSVKESGAVMLRGGAFKPRTSPYAFQGLEMEGLKLLKIAREISGLPVVSEITAPRYIDAFEESVDMIQIGARNMQNFELLREVGKSKKPILLKRGLSSTIEEWLMSAEYILHQGNENVILCERGVRTFETYTRNTLDVSSIVAVKKLSHLPVIADPSHASGKSWMALPLALASLSAGADGLIIEVHNDPERALCDGAQSITPKTFNTLMESVNIISSSIKKIKELHNAYTF